MAKGGSRLAPPCCYLPKVRQSSGIGDVALCDGPIAVFCHQLAGFAIVSIEYLISGYIRGRGANRPPPFMANLGIPANTLKDLMGHSSIVTTMEYYVKILDENKISAAEKLNAVAVV